MSKLINISVDLTKIDKSKIIIGKKGGKYINLDLWINDKEDQYGKNCSLNIPQSKEEREAKAKIVYCGNGKTIFGFGESVSMKHKETNSNSSVDADDEIPF